MSVRLYQSQEKLPLSRALLWILLSVLLISGTAFMGRLYFLHVKERRLRDDQYRITAIVKKGAAKNPLQTAYLAELLGLSADRPMNLFLFNAHEGAQKLLASPVIKKAEIKKVVPGTLLIDYQTRNPVAYLGNASNTLLDAEGYLFPHRPFYAAKELPVFYLGLEGLDSSWGGSLKGRKDLDLAFGVYKNLVHVRQFQLELKRIDVSNAFADSIGQREIVVMLEESDPKRKGSLIYLRLNAKEYEQNIANFLILRSRELMDLKRGVEKGKIIDLRLSNLAFIKRET